MGVALKLLWGKVPLWLKLALAIVIAVALAYQLGRWNGAADKLDELRMAAIKEATGRIISMENNNEDFRRKSPRDKCLVIMRYSGLPDSGCD